MITRTGRPTSTGLACTLALAAAGTLGAWGCAGSSPKSDQPAQSQAPASSLVKENGEDRAAAAQWVELAPGVRVNRAARALEFEGRVPIDAYDPQTPRVYLEVIVTGPDTREHEALVVTNARPAAVHAGLLALGLNPGQPGRVEGGANGPVALDPRGDRVRVEFRYVDERGQERTATPEAWIRSARDGRRLVGIGPGVWRFAGSRFVKRSIGGQVAEVYDADGTGVLIGLHAFGSEVLAFPKAMSPDAGTEAPEWIAELGSVPRAGTKVTVRLSAMD